MGIIQIHLLTWKFPFTWGDARTDKHLVPHVRGIYPLSVVPLFKGNDTIGASQSKSTVLDHMLKNFQEKFYY